MAGWPGIECGKLAIPRNAVWRFQRLPYATACPRQIGRQGEISLKRRWRKAVESRCVLLAPIKHTSAVSPTAETRISREKRRSIDPRQGIAVKTVPW